MSRSAFIIYFLLLCSSLRAQEPISVPDATKSGMILVGTVSDAHADKDSIRFLFTGTVVFTFRHYTPDRQIARWEVRDLPVSASAWSEPSATGSNPYTVNFANAVEFATKLSKDNRKTSIGVDERIAVVFDDFGQIKSVEGGRISFWPPK